MYLKLLFWSQFMRLNTETHPVPSRPLLSRHAPPQCHFYFNEKQHLRLHVITKIQLRIDPVTIALLRFPPGPCENVKKIVGSSAELKKSIRESKVLNRSLAVTLSLLALSVGTLHTEDVLRILRRRSFHVTQVNDRMFTLKDCRVLRKSMACVAEDGENNSESMNKEQAKTG